MSRVFRIACYGYVGKNVGSGVGSDFMILEELLNRGFEIDFYGWEGSNKPNELLKWKNFKFVSLPDKSLVRAFERLLPKSLQKPFNSTIHAVLHVLFVAPADNRQLRREVISQHTNKRYDFLLYLGLHALFRIEDAPTLSWIQGPPQTEWLYIKKLRKTIVSLCGSVTYLKTMAYYALEKTRLTQKISNSDILICSSQWSKDNTISYGIPQEKVKVLPFPIDMKIFDVDPYPRISAIGRRKTFLWLGRLDPRKRLDLLLEAYRLLLKERQDVDLKIIGSFRYYKGYKKLIDSFEFPGHIEYQSSISRSEVPNLLKQCDILIQPSEGENFGFSVAEALCCGLPVIVGSTNGTKDFISDSSFVFEQYTPESLKETMVEAIRAIEEFPEKLAQDARKAAEMNFNIVTVVNDLEALLKDAKFERSRDLTSKEQSPADSRVRTNSTDY